MKRVIEAPSSEPAVRAILVGGPASLPEDSRVQEVSHRSDKVKVAHHGGYEHFERLTAPDEVGNPDEIQFHWTMRTSVAE